MINTHDQSQRSSLPCQNCQVSFMNIYSSIEAGTQYAGLDRSKWKLNQLLIEYFSSNQQILTVIAKMKKRSCEVGAGNSSGQEMLQVKAIPKSKFHELEQWVKQVKWQIDLTNFKKLGEMYADVLYAAVRTKIEGGHWSNTQGIQMSIKNKQLEIAKGTVLLDAFGNNVGQYIISPNGLSMGAQDRITVRITDITFCNKSFAELTAQHLSLSNFKPHTQKYLGFRFQSFKVKLTDESMKPVLGATNMTKPGEEWAFVAVAGDGWISVNKDTPLSYEMKSIAAMVLRSISKTPAEESPNYLNLFHTAQNSQVFFTNMVEILYNDIVIQSCLINEKNME